MLLLKLTLVPLFIAAVTLAGRRWGSAVAGLLGGFPVVAGPIVILIALEQGQTFGATTATAAMSAVAALLAFGIAYCWASLRWTWPIALLCGLLAWGLIAPGLAMLPPAPGVALAVAVVALLATPRLLPTVGAPLHIPQRGWGDLPWRMLAGALLTLAVTSAATTLGQVWSGIFAAFPVLGLILAVFTQRAQGGPQVTQFYRGMVRGLYSLVGFFATLALLWPRLGFWLPCLLACAVAPCIQIRWRSRARR